MPELEITCIRNMAKKDEMHRAVNLFQSCSVLEPRAYLRIAPASVVNGFGSHAKKAQSRAPEEELVKIDVMGTVEAILDSFGLDKSNIEQLASLEGCTHTLRRIANKTGVLDRSDCIWIVALGQILEEVHGVELENVLNYRKLRRVENARKALEEEEPVKVPFAESTPASATSVNHVGALTLDGSDEKREVTIEYVKNLMRREARKRGGYLLGTGTSPATRIITVLYKVPEKENGQYTYGDLAKELGLPILTLALKKKEKVIRKLWKYTENRILLNNTEVAGLLTILTAYHGIKDLGKFLKDNGFSYSESLIESKGYDASKARKNLLLKIDPRSGSGEKKALKIIAEKVLDPTSQTFDILMSAITMQEQDFEAIAKEMEMSAEKIEHIILSNLAGTVGKELEKNGFGLKELFDLTARQLKEIKMRRKG